MSWQRRSLAAALCAGVLFAAPLTVRAGQWDDRPAEKTSAKDAASSKPEKERATGKEAINAALRRKIDAQLIHLPLSQFAEWIEQQGGIEVEIDRRATSDSGLDPDSSSEISMDMRGVTLRSILHHALRPHDLTWTISDDVLLITTKESAAARLVMEVYPTVDLLRFRGPDGKVTEKTDHFRKLITSTCSPPAWDDVGGPGSLSEFEGMLVVSQTGDVQSQVVAVLEAVRATIVAQKNGEIGSRAACDGSADDAAIRAALASESRFELIQLPLNLFAEQIEQEKKVQLLVDLRAFVEAGIDVDTVELTADIAFTPLHLALNRVLHPHDLTYIVDHEAIVITTQERAAAILETEVYSIADLIAGEPVAGEQSIKRGERLTELLASTVDPPSWDHVGGSSHVEFVEPWNLLVVSAPAATQRKVGETLAKLRAAKRQETETNLAPGDAATTDDPVELRVFPIASMGGGNDDTATKIAEVVRELLPEVGQGETGDNEGSPYMRALPDRMVVRHRRSVLAKVETLLKKLETPKSQQAATASAVTR